MGMEPGRKIFIIQLEPIILGFANCELHAWFLIAPQHWRANKTRTIYEPSCESDQYVLYGLVSHSKLKITLLHIISLFQTTGLLPHFRLLLDLHCYFTSLIAHDYGNKIGL